MATFEKLSEIKYIQDDTDNLVCTLENAQNINKHTEYILRVQKGPSKGNKWTVSRRYRDFASLHLSIQQAYIDLPLPPKKLIGNMQPSFIAERQVALQQYVNEILKYQILALSLPVRRFLDPCSYPLHLAEEALQTVSIALRGDGQYELKGPLQNINWRIRKHYFHVVDSKRTNCLLAWQSYGPDKHLYNKDLQIALKSMQSLSHPFIGEILTFHILESGAFVVRQLHEQGTMRDLLYGTEYDKSYLAKYGNPKVRKPFTTRQIAHYGYQILQALKFLHDKGLPHESILHLTLSSSSWKRGGATLDELLQHPFFVRALNGFVERDVKGHLKFPLTLKEQIKEAALCVESRLKTDQKLLRTARREVRIQEILGSDEEMKKQRRKAKKRDSMWKSMSSLAETVRSQSASTTSSPTPPATAYCSTTGDSSGASPPAAGEGRGALLQAICSFNKKSLARVGSR
ncbi:PX domain-containing protein kinase-like protein isoform X5 [Pieris brassicae]|uniref:PX domain-containing protein kinase-like protein isoform X5 n=1 Tax=Pieris brassicae TaxID=7116 RepID=UPI001E661352|nr:PX domain-containing protein kinase-like protein isoform X5 [Pieris brassicae]